MRQQAVSLPKQARAGSFRNGGFGFFTYIGVLQTWFNGLVMSPLPTVSTTRPSPLRFPALAQGLKQFGDSGHARIFCFPPELDRPILLKSL